ncbi:GGDEF domain-containing protein [Halomonas sp. 328]|uniref:GGDEF domain-containing protein n=1 Tax=Halomonas sp. 328 TaxID=2776704 RepID=UPI0018A7A69D|nr:GGDEF domain-containing protein [Halomonas sp. 328]MBF8221281.1 GGDEF domain-containing protein [Halomonas sp. 328]
MPSLLPEEEKLWPSRLFALVYAAGAVLMAGYALWHYLMGDYGLIPLPALLSLLLVGATLLRLSHHPQRYLSAYLVLISAYLLIAVEVAKLEGGAGLWLGLPPVLAFLVLPPASAILLNVLLGGLWLVLLVNPEQAGDLAMAYLVLTLLGALAGGEQARQRELLEATRPHDDECEALRASAIRECLAQEFYRARRLDHRLSVLVIHLPQLDNPGDAFGGLTRRECLQRFTEVTQHSCRAPDQLGRLSDSLFWLLLPDTGQNGALMVRQRLLDALERITLPDGAGLSLRMALCAPHDTESLATFEQRLELKAHLLMESTT